MSDQNKCACCSLSKAGKKKRNLHLNRRCSQNPDQTVKTRKRWSNTNQDSVWISQSFSLSQRVLFQNLAHHSQSVTQGCEDQIWLEISAFRFICHVCGEESERLACRLPNQRTEKWGWADRRCHHVQNKRMSGAVGLFLLNAIMLPLPLHVQFIIFFWWTCPVRWTTDACLHWRQWSLFSAVSCLVCSFLSCHCYYVLLA